MPAIEYGVTISPITGRPIYRTHREEQAANEAARRAASQTAALPSLPELDTGAPAVTPPPAGSPLSGTASASTGMAAPDWLSQWDELNALLQNRQTTANMGRIPMLPELEESSSRSIMELLNPPNQFAEVDQRSAELAAARGVPGSAAGMTAGYRMTDEERLRRMALGQQFLTAATSRNPTVPISASDALQTVITPEEREQLDQDWRRIEIQMRQLGLSEDEIELARDRFNLDRAQAGRTGLRTDASGNPTGQRINIAGTGYNPRWITVDPYTGGWT